MTNELTEILSKIKTRPLIYTIEAINMILWMNQRSIARSRQIIEALGKMKKCKVGDELLSLLANPQLDDVLRWECVRALGRVGEKKAASILLSIILDAQADEEIRECAAEAIGNLGETSILPQLFSLLSNEAIATSVRTLVARSIGELGSRSVVDHFLSLIANEHLHPDVRCSIISVLEKIQEDEIVESVEPLLPHNHIAITGVVGRPSAHTIVSLLSKKNIEVNLRQSIISALESNERISLVPKLEELLVLEHLNPVVHQYVDKTLNSLKAFAISRNVQSSQNQANLRKEKKSFSVSDERRFAVTKAEIEKLVKRLQKSNTSCFTKLRGYPKGHQDWAVESKIERASDIYYELWKLSQQIGVRIYIVNTSAGTEVKLTKWGTLEE